MQKPPQTALHPVTFFQGKRAMDPTAHWLEVNVLSWRNLEHWQRQKIHLQFGLYQILCRNIDLQTRNEEK